MRTTVAEVASTLGITEERARALLPKARRAGASRSTGPSNEAHDANRSWFDCIPVGSVVS